MVQLISRFSPTSTIVTVVSASSTVNNARYRPTSLSSDEPSGPAASFSDAACGPAGPLPALRRGLQHRLPFKMVANWLRCLGFLSYPSYPSIPCLPSMPFIPAILPCIPSCTLCLNTCSCASCLPRATVKLTGVRSAFWQGPRTVSLHLPFCLLDL